MHDRIETRDFEHANAEGNDFVGPIDSAAAPPGFLRKGSMIAGTKHLAAGSNLRVKECPDDGA
jgi:hypothetical protein